MQDETGTCPAPDDAVEWMQGRAYTPFGPRSHDYLLMDRLIQSGNGLRLISKFLPLSGDYAALITQ
jgi:hypothetical protein